MSPVCESETESRLRRAWGNDDSCSEPLACLWTVVGDLTGINMVVAVDPGARTVALLAEVVSKGQLVLLLVLDSGRLFVELNAFRSNDSVVVAGPIETPAVLLGFDCGNVCARLDPVARSLIGIDWRRVIPHGTYTFGPTESVYTSCETSRVGTDGSCYTSV